MMRRNAPYAPLLALAGLVACTPLEARLARGGETTAEYRLRVSPDLAQVEAEVRLGRRSGPALLRLARRRGWQERQAALRDVRCLHGEPLARFREEGWVLPAACAGARWTVPLAPIPPRGYDVPSLRAAASKARDLAILPGAAVLLVPHAFRGEAHLVLEPGPGRPAHHALEPAPDGTLRLPALPDAADVLLGVGRFETRVARAGDLAVKHCFAGALPTALPRLVAENGKALAWLRGVLGGPAARRWQVFWFPTARSGMPLGGAAARRSLAVSWREGLRPAPHLRPALLPFVPLLLVLHEQVHLLLGDRPAWLGESLAQHYALEALGRSGLVTPEAWQDAWTAITRPWSLTPEADARVPLLAAVRRYQRTGDARAFGLLYTNGPRFWRALDLAIRAHGRVPAGLDGVIRRLLALPWRAEDALPPGFARILREAAGPASDPLLAQLVTGARAP